MRIALVAAALALAGRADAQTSQEGGLHVEMVSSPAPGAIQVLLSPDAKHDKPIGAKPAAADFTMWLRGGAAPNLAVARNGGRGKPLTTVVLLDESASYKTGVGTKVALPAISEYAKDAATDELALVAFSLDTNAFPMHVGPADFLADLQAAGARKVGQATSVTIGLAAGIELATKEGEPGLREVILFTDAGDEAEVDKSVWAKLTEQAKAAGVRVSVVLPTDDQKPAGTKHELWVTTTTNLNHLAAETAGTFLTSNDPAPIAAALGEARTRVKSWLVLDAKLCGVHSNEPVDVRVEYAPKAKREAWSGGAQLAAAAWAPGSEAACLEPRTEKPVAGAAPPPPPEVKKKSSLLIWILAGSGGLLLIAALFVLLRKKPEPVVTAPPPEPEPVPEAPAPAVDLDPLPETHLVALGGWATPGERWRLHKRKTIAGGAADVDLQFGVQQISGRHAQFELFPSGDLWITDLGSTNGTFVNGKRLGAKERVKLAIGDQVKLSQHLTLVVERPGVSAPEPPVKKAKQKTKFDPGNR